LFLMNSDFMQQQAERLARKVEGEADNSARVTKAYRLVFGRAPTPDELTAGVAYLSAEPLRAYEERKKKAEAEKAEAAAKKIAGAPEAGTPVAATTDAAPNMGEGMMAGVMAPSGSTTPEDEKKKMLPVTPLGRYLKVLLSSSEFLFVD
jgi:hypothetical protein